VEAVLSNQGEKSAAMRRGTSGGSGQMPAGMMAELQSGAFGVADGMPVGTMNAAGQMPNASFAGNGPLQEMPPAGPSSFQEMPTGSMASAAPAAGKFAEMPRAGAAPSGASAAAAPSPDGTVVLAGEWRLHLTIRGAS
jgi:hypothetical protein